jgi:hypothetical protein
MSFAGPATRQLATSARRHETTKTNKLKEGRPTSKAVRSALVSTPSGFDERHSLCAYRNWVFHQEIHGPTSLSLGAATPCAPFA